MSSQQPTTEDYNLPSVGEMIKNNTLSYHIMRTRDPNTGGWGIFDHGSLVLLRRFIDHPERKEQILRDMGMEGTIANPLLAADKYRNLVGFIVARHETETQRDGNGEIVLGTGPVFTEQEIEELRAWYESGKWERPNET